MFTDLELPENGITDMYSSTRGFLLCTYYMFGVIINKAAMSIHVHAFVCMCFYFSGKYVKVKLLGHRAVWGKAGGSCETRGGG